MKVLVVDDEPLARRRLIRMLARIPNVSVAGEAGDAESALEHIRTLHPDLVLLDIRMPGISGLQLAASGGDLPPIVFTTAYDEYAVDAFQVSAVDYLLKPVQRQRLAAAIDKVRRRTGHHDAARIQSLLERLDRALKTGATSHLHARAGNTTRLFDAREITRIYASEKYALFRYQGREYVLDESLNTLAARLQADGFLRIHRSELVNLAHVRALHTEDGATTVQLSDGQKAEVSRRTLSALKEKLGIR
jgi:DNA-binding LytR/AlgR family response regulator